MAHSEELREAVRELVAEELSNREIARRLLGKSSSESTIRSIRSRYEHTWQQDLEDGPNTLVFDIETSPMKGYFWGLFKQNINLNAIIDDWIVLTWAAKWIGKDEVLSDTVANYDYLGGSDYLAEYCIIKSIWDLLDKADFVVAHNGKKFDKKKLNAKFLEHGLGEPSPYKVIDTLNIVKANFALTSNKLDYITKFLGGEGKLETGGMQLWIDFLNNCPIAQQKMLDYNIQDVTELEGVYLKLREWDKFSPNSALYYSDNVTRCTVCGSTELHPLENKFAYTNLSKFEVLRCKCGKYSRGRINLLSQEKRKSLVSNIL